MTHFPGQVPNAGIAKTKFKLNEYAAWYWEIQFGDLIRSSHGGTPGKPHEGTAELRVPAIH
jgi:hypothetical protein